MRVAWSIWAGCLYVFNADTTSEGGSPRKASEPTLLRDNLKEVLQKILATSCSYPISLLPFLLFLFAGFWPRQAQLLRPEVMKRTRSEARELVEFGKIGFQVSLWF